MATIKTANYTIGGIDIYFDPTTAHASLLGGSPAGTAFRATGKRNIGNIVTAEFNPDITYVDHFISVKGARRKDLIQPTTKSLMINFTFDEINASNMKRFFLASSLGTVKKLAPMEESLPTGSVSMLFSTDVGRDFVYSIPYAIIRPDGALAMNIEDWWSGPMILDVLYYNTGQWASKPYGIIDMSAIA